MPSRRTSGSEALNLCDLAPVCRMLSNSESQINEAMARHAAAPAEFHSALQTPYLWSRFHSWSHLTRALCSIVCGGSRAGQTQHFSDHRGVVACLHFETKAVRQRAHPEIFRQNRGHEFFDLLVASHPD
jgi:hypothetical protein